MEKTQETGGWGEQVVTDYLTREGYAIKERNWRLNHLEIDIIAEKDGYVAFVEVKTRGNDEISAFLAIDRRKINNIVKAANAYIKQTNPHLKPRFDVAAVYGNKGNNRLEYVVDAFRPPLRTYR